MNSKTLARRIRLNHPWSTLVLAGFVLASHFLFGLPPRGSGESGNITYHSAASEVRLVFFATDENNRSVQGLQQSDFAIVDNDRVIRDFRSFIRSELVKLDIAVLIDSSESVSPRLQKEAEDVAQLISQWSPNSDDNISVYSFHATETHLLCSGNCRSVFTADRDATFSWPRGGSTPLFDSLEVAADSLIEHQQPDVWPVIILFSDGDDTISKASFPEAFARILESGALVYAIDVGDPRRPSDGTAMLQRIAGGSGGRYVRIKEGVASILDDVIDDLHSARVVTYAAPEFSAGFHSIRILPTHNLNLQFRCRRGYYRESRGSHPEDVR